MTESEFFKRSVEAHREFRKWYEKRRKLPNRANIAMSNYEPLDITSEKVKT